MRSASVPKVLLASLALSLAAAACSSGGDGEGTSGGGDPTGGGLRSYGNPNAPADLEFWTWATNIEKVVDIWNEQHPDQQVEVNSQAQGDELVTRLLTAAKAGNAPCLMQTEYQALPTLVSNGVATDITAAADTVRGEFSGSTWGLTSFSDQTFAIPQDIAPMMLYYREDLFRQMGLEVPQTWDEYADLAAEVRDKAPDSYLTTFSSNDPGWFAGLAQQAGADWWSTNGNQWSVGIDDAATQRVADYWGGLVSSGTVDGQPMYTPQWNRAMSDGTLLTWPSAVWGAAVLEGVAPTTKGKWAAAPLPAWSEDTAASGFWGGSATAVSEDCEDKAQALKFATWLNTDPEAVSELITTSGVYPASTEGQSSPAFDEPPAMMPNQPGFYDLATQAAENARPFTWGPNVNVTYSVYSDAFQQAIEEGGSFTSAVQAMQEETVADLKEQGFTVSE
jgi:multiple sugar transport system substrate-binding protein